MENLKIKSSYYTDFFEKEFTTNANYIGAIGDLLKESIDEESGEIKNVDFLSVLGKVSYSNNIINSLYYVSNKTGNLITSTGKNKLSQMSTDLRKRDWYKSSIILSYPIISDVYEDINTSKPCISISYALRKNDKVLGVISGDIMLENLSDYYFNLTKEDTFCINVISTEGNIIINHNKASVGKSFSANFDDNSPTKKYINDSISWNFILEQLSQNIEFISTSNEHVDSYYSTSNLLGWKVFCIAKKSMIEKSLKQYMFILIIIGILSILVFVSFFHMYFDILQKYDNTTWLMKQNQFLRYLKNKYKTPKNLKLLFISISNLDILKSELDNETIDKILQDYSKILKTIIGKQAKISIGYEDIFILSFYTYKDNKDLTRIMERILNEISFIEIKASDESLSLDSLYVYVDFQGYEIKNLEKNIRIAESSIRKKQHNTTGLINLSLRELIEEAENDNKKLKTLRRVIKNKNIIPFYQPIYDIKKNKIAKYEVLMRLKCNEHYLLPYPYILIGEKYNLIEEMDLIILEKALKYKNEIDIEDKLIFSFNISGKCLNDSTHLMQASNIVDKYNINHKNIEFEITETENVQNLNLLTQTISKYIDKGYTFSIDDFGVAYSTIGYLKKIPCQNIKIDGSFIKDINANEKNLYLAKSIVSMAKGYDKTTVAEFIENEEILTTLKSIDVDYGQGFYLGKPSEFIEK
ncbi:EAL domain-containing protein [Clostridium sediminicola]|uniref:EAL domain-containing protein n=1 Tax=Clostridium sediminicola TaxID=3114879 RepID=UPI003D171525